MKVGLIQLNANGEKLKNIDNACRLVRKAASLGAKVIILPEVFNYRGSLVDEELYNKIAEVIPGESIIPLIPSAKLLYNSVLTPIETSLRPAFLDEVIFPRMWVSAQLGFIALILVFGLGILFGLIAAWANGSWIDPLIISVLLFLQAIPILVVITTLLWLFDVQLNLLPVG